MAQSRTITLDLVCFHFGAVLGDTVMWLANKYSQIQLNTTETTWPFCQQSQRLHADTRVAACGRVPQRIICVFTECRCCCRTQQLGNGTTRLLWSTPILHANATVNEQSTAGNFRDGIHWGVVAVSNVPGAPGPYRTCLFSSATSIFPLDFSSLEQICVYSSRVCALVTCNCRGDPPSTFLPPCFIPTAVCASAPRPRRKSCSN